MRKLPTHEIERHDAQSYQAADKTPVVVVLDNVRSALNVGSVFRTADAFALRHVYLCGITATPPSRDIMKTAIGADETVDWTHHQSTLDLVVELKQQGYTVYAVEQTEQPIYLQDFKVAKPNSLIAVVMGNEVTGVDQAVLNECDGAIEIPQFGTKHSLNVAVCTGVVVWELVRQLRW